MSNGYKLILFVLVFFLGLTFVRALEYGPIPSEVVFEGNAPAKLIFTLTNSSMDTITPTIALDGPIQITQTDPSTTRMLGKSTQTFTLTLLPTETLGTGDTYKGMLRISTPAGEKKFPILFSHKEAVFSFAGNPAAGLATGISFPNSPNQNTMVNAVLGLVALVLLIAFVARVKNRM